VFRDTPRPDGRTLIYLTMPELTQGKQAGVNGHEVQLVTTWWQAGDSKYYECRVTLGEASMSLVPAFEKVCARVVPR